MSDAARVLLRFVAHADVRTLGHYGPGDVAGFAAAQAAELVRAGVARHATAEDLAAFADPRRGLRPETHEHPL